MQASLLTSLKPPLNPSYHETVAGEPQQTADHQTAQEEEVLQSDCYTYCGIICMSNTEKTK